MPFVDQILQHGSVSIVGLAKNAGKTEVLNYVLREAETRMAEMRKKTCNEVFGAETRNVGKSCDRKIAVTSIGLDGESVDRVCGTQKPEIEIYRGMIFVTSETHYRQKRLAAEVLDVGDRETALGRLVTARALTTGRAMLSGPSDSESLKALIMRLSARFGVTTTIVDGALSRLSHGSPAVTDAMVLVTGAAVSESLARLVRETRYVYDRVMLEAVDEELRRRLEHIESGVWAVDEEGEAHDLGVRSAFALGGENVLKHDSSTIYAAGAVGDRLLEELRAQKRDIVLIIRDFTRVFATLENYYAFLRQGGEIKVLQRSKLLAVCVNPTAPSGYSFDSEVLVEAVRNALGVPVYDIRRI